ncbi:hypothetical protein [Gracilimonas sediminicola]|uniref:Uncharacterized protein n=1 Tax=Gracilimonas sediminicola TaxID=2952158 RepID=A0A9X2RHF3_9BACT|nr:hypothetical protein [Gracilimonas sediminicola]MCP9292258.1 hypothetical protein [Gracilimonas sediminicola]
MKTHLNSTKQLRMLVVLFVTSIVLTYACKQVNSPFEEASQQGQTIEGLNINVKYAEVYDQTEITYSRLWPQGISAGLNKSQSNGGELLVDYEKTREIIAYDEEGYMTSITEFLEGDGEMNMPEEAYNQHKATMPAKSADHDPVVKTEVKDGKVRSYTKSGKLKYESTYDPEEFWVDPASLELLVSATTDTSDVEQSIQSNIESLANDGISFSIVDEFYAKYNIKSPVEAQENGLAAYQLLMDLRNGNIIGSAILRSDGEYESVSFNMYKNVGNTQMLAYSEKYDYGVINGKWGITQRTVMHRENIKVIK